MAQIHPTSLVDPQATLAEDVVVGPWCLIEGQVSIGAGSRLMERVTLKGPLVIGSHNVVYPNCCLGLEPQDRKFDPATQGSGVVIGDHNILREGVTIHRATGPLPTTLGSHNMLMAGSHLAHDCIVGSHCIFANSTLLAGHTTVADHVVMSGHTGSHQFCRIGRMAIVSGNQAVFEDLPPFCSMASFRSVDGLNLVGLRRAGYRRHIGALKSAFDLFFRSHHSRPVAIELIQSQHGDDPLCREFLDFVRQPSRRGITKCRSARLVDTDS